MRSQRRASPLLDQLLTVVKSEAVKDLGKAMAVVALAVLGRTLHGQYQWFRYTMREVSRSLWQVEQTNQVLASRSNLQEWRQFLETVSKWHNCTLQAAYSIWQHDLSGFPACPPNQWGLLPTGQPLAAVDQFKADLSVTQCIKDIQYIDSRLSTIHEYELLRVSGKMSFSAADLSDIAQFLPKYHEWQAIVQEFHGFSKEVDESVVQRVKNFKASVNWNSAIFSGLNSKKAVVSQDSVSAEASTSGGSQEAETKLPKET